MKKILLLLCITLSATLTQAQNVLLLNGTAHTATGKVIDKSAVGIKDGKIVLVAEAAAADQKGYDKVIDITGKHIYPGFIAPNSTLGLREIDAVRATIDYAETGSLNPNVRSLIAYNTDSRIIPTLRYNGVMIAQVTPRGGVIPGTSSVVALDGWNWEDAAYKVDDAIHMNWPRIFTQQWTEHGPGAVEPNKNRINQLNELKSFFREARAYAEVAQPTRKNLKFDAMRGLFTGTQRLFINATEAKEIVEAVNFARENGVQNIVIVGGAESWRITDFLRENKVPVVVGRVHDLPTRQDDDIDIPFKLPYLLHKAGVQFCLNYEGDMEVMGTRNLPFTAGTSVAYGLTKEEALQAITLNAAKILGIDKMTGSLEVGKDANLFVSTGDALDMRGNNVELAFIRGRQIDLETHQQQLYRKYQAKYKEAKPVKQ